MQLSVKSFTFSVLTTDFPSSALTFSVRLTPAGNTPQRKNKTTGTEMEHHLNTERAEEHHTAPIIQKEEEDSFSVMSQIVPCTERTVCLPPRLSETVTPQRILDFLSF